MSFISSLIKRLRRSKNTDVVHDTVGPLLNLAYSSLLLLGTLAGMFLTYVAPVAFIFAHDPLARILGASAWLLMSLLYLPAIRFYRLSQAWTMTLPLTALFYSYATFVSAARYYLGRGAQWKGRSQAHGPI